MLSFLALRFACALAFCDCTLPPSVTESFTTYDVIFSGQVLSVQTYDARRDTVSLSHPHSGLQRDLLIVLFRIEEVYKGPSFDTTSWLEDDSTSLAVVITGDTSYVCGFPFQHGRSYLVYAAQSHGNYHTSSCSRTTDLSEGAQPELDELRRLRASRR